METNKFKMKDNFIILYTKKPMSEQITREFTEYTIKDVDGLILYEFNPMPNMCFALRALIAKYPIFQVDKDVLELIYKKTQYATMPVLSLYQSNKHVEINCPPLNYYLDLVNAVGAAAKGMNSYTVPIARAYDVIRASEYKTNYLPKFAIAQSLKNEVASPLEGFDTTIASLFAIPLEELHAANSAYRIAPENFRNMGYDSVADFLIKQPRRYIDKTKITSLDDIEVNESIVFIGKITNKKLIMYKHANFTIDVAGVKYQSTFYNRSWMIDKFELGTEVLIMGEYKGKGNIAGQSLESIVEAQALDIVPIYPQSGVNKITSKVILNVVYEAIERVKPFAHELTKYIKLEETKISLGQAIREMHFPSSSESYIAALETLALYELIYLQLLITHRKATETKDKGVSKPYVKGGYFDNMVDSLPWRLTNGQQSGLNKLNEYMSIDVAEQILLNGDVGSGKTIIAQLACMQTLDNGYQSVLAGPTEVLATQLYDTFTKVISGMTKKPTIAFLGGKMKVKEKRDILSAVKLGGIDILIGTHSVLNKDIEFKNLGLIIIDEQQKFGTAQREALLDSRNDGRKPDLLAQTATPIPRSTAQAFYGDINLISVTDKPEGRIEIVTEWIKEDPKTITKDKNHDVWKDVMSEIEKGHQAFVVVPMVYESAKMDSASVEGAYANLCKALPKARIGFTHGQQKAADKQQVMEDFRNKDLDILIASTVIEVGVDVPNATRIVVLSADRLGASSLHQIRGRVGRSNLPSTCYLVSEGNTLSSQRRLQALVDSTDGFEIAKVDLETRGQGDVFGLRQAGESNLKFSNLIDHSKLVDLAQQKANEIYNSPYKNIAIRDAQAILLKGDGEDA